jgi:hypothetical protein
LLAASLILIAVNTGTENRLEREIKGVENRQIQRLDPSAKPRLPHAETENYQPPAK